MISSDTNKAICCNKSLKRAAIIRNLELKRNQPDEMRLHLKEAIDLEICNDNTEENGSSNPSFHTPNPLLTSSPPTIPTCFPPAHWMSLLALVIARGWVTCRMTETPKPDIHLYCVSLQSLRLSGDAARGLKIQEVVEDHRGRGGTESVIRQWRVMWAVTGELPFNELQFLSFDFYPGHEGKLQCDCWK